MEHGAKVVSLTKEGGDFVARTARAPTARRVSSSRSGSVPLARSVGIEVPIRPERGQILVTERLRPDAALCGIRRPPDLRGAGMIGATQEDVGFDLGTTVAHGAAMAKRAIEILPALAEARFVRTWAGLRVLTPDRNPAYVESETHPGAFLVTCHSGVTLAAAHAEVLGPSLAKASCRSASTPFIRDGSRQMFRKLPDAPGEAVTVTVEGRPVRVTKGDSAAAAALLAGLVPTRLTPVDDSPRAPYCMMGVCFECLMVIDGVPSRQACLVPVAEGMRIERQAGRRATRSMTAPANYDLAVIGAGPAGLAGATLAAGLGLKVVLLDEQERPGGQIYRGVEIVAHGLRRAARGRLSAGAELAAAFQASGADYLCGAQVWQVERGFTLFHSHAARGALVDARAVLIAVGALERPVPVPGWTLPG